MGEALTIRIVLDEREFRDLVRGKVAKTRSSQGEDVELILADIGFARMLDIVRAAVAEGMTPQEFVRDRDP